MKRSVCIASIYRTIIVQRLSHSDATWADIDPSIWAVVENAIGILCASLPTMRPIFIFFRRGHFCNTSQQQYCDRCTSKRSKGSQRTESVPMPTNQDWRRGEGQSYANIESVEKGGSITSKSQTTTFEMC